MWKRFVDVLPAESLAVHVIVVRPNPKIEPDVGVQSTGIDWPLWSTAEATYVTVAPAKP